MYAPPHGHPLLRAEVVAPLTPARVLARFNCWFTWEDFLQVLRRTRELA